MNFIHLLIFAKQKTLICGMYFFPSRQGSVIAESIAVHNYPNNNSKIMFLNNDLGPTLEKIFNDSDSFKNLSIALGNVSIQDAQITMEPVKISCKLLFFILETNNLDLTYLIKEEEELDLIYLRVIWIIYCFCNMAYLFFVYRSFRSICAMHIEFCKLNRGD